MGPVEMVTVPALGPEWKADELRNMTKAGKREDKAERRAQKWKEWRRGERGLCGRYFTRKFLAWFGLFFCCAYAKFPPTLILMSETHMYLPQRWSRLGFHNTKSSGLPVQPGYTSDERIHRVQCLGAHAVHPLPCKLQLPCKC